MTRIGFSVLAALAACGGTAVIDPPLGEGGATSATTNGTGTGTGTGGAATTTVTTSTGNTTTTGPSDPCVVACTSLYQCALEGDANGQQLCPGFVGTQSEEATFLYGGDGGCVDACHSLMAIVELVDPDDCPGTIATFEAASPDFAELCQNGF